ncbi:MAG: hypothetical protein ACRD5B_14645 [Nitrososphaeraceae archaeon]
MSKLNQLCQSSHTVAVDLILMATLTVTGSENTKRICAKRKSLEKKDAAYIIILLATDAYFLLGIKA